jgi:hypothetical protein
MMAASPKRPQRFLPRALAACLLVVLGIAPVRPGPNPLPQKEQEDVNEALDMGAVYLQKNQQLDGSWATEKEGHRVAYAALPGLTLLECGVSAKDNVVQKAARFVRTNWAKLKDTYDVSLAILFLDRLGDRKDKALIQVLALRLIAGQTPTGGWSYVVPVLNGYDHKELLSVLRKLKAQSPPVESRDLVNQDRFRFGTGRCIKMAEGIAPDDESAKDIGTPKKPVRSVKKGRPKKVVIPARMRSLPVLRDPTKLALQDPDKKTDAPFFGTTDNSNTQFAILALWAARRHGVPIDRTLKLIAQRFETSQNADGGWGYRYKKGGGEGGGPPMIACGLLGLAVGHGLTEAKDQQKQGPQVVKGFVALANHIGKPANKMRNLPMQNLYFLWSLERVGMLYDLKTIGDKDWYRWGAEILVANQKGDGNWDKGGYPGASPTIDTCLALLFLKRVNLAKDLTEKLPDSKDLTKKIADQIPPKPTEKEKPKPPTKFPETQDTTKQEPTPPKGNPDPSSKDLKPQPKPETSSAADNKDEGKKEEGGGGSLWGVLFAILGVLLLVAAGLFLFLRPGAAAEAEPPPKRKKKKRSPPKDV